MPQVPLKDQAPGTPGHYSLPIIPKRTGRAAARAGKT